MKERLVQWLACPECGGNFTLEVTERVSDEVKSGELRCSRGGHRFPVMRSIPRFVESDQYVGNFSLEWLRNRTTQIDSHTKRDDSEVTFRQKCGFRRADLDGKLVLDVGVGTGRFLEIAKKCGGEVIGIDLSYAVEAAFANFGKNPKVHIIQADIFRLPFKPEIFDAIYSIGVLHHTPNTKEAFLRLPRLLKKQGKIAIWVYDYYSHLPIIMSRYYRRITTRLPKRLLYYLCYIAIPYYYLLKVPFLRHIFRAILPTAPWPDWRWRVLDTFDWYSPKYQWWHTDHEVFAWFEEAGLKNVRVLELPVAISGEKV
ncbi:MAG: methyltransferase domain-containing protein [Candidatus Kerfeldbacteria bacterium]|nr:methyltransferase domain-containing protein [Candidatus Kerfeldbacteria bacterium]